MTIFDGWVEFYPDLLRGLLVSVRLAGVSLLFGLPLGLLLALCSYSQNLTLRTVVITLVEIGRGTPTLVMLQIVYFGLPSAGLNFTAFIAAALALTLTTGAYTSEIIRGGLQSVPEGHVEAAEACGMPSRDVLRFVVIPQGLRVAIPALLGFAILIFQATSLAYTIAVPELLGRAYSIGSQNFNYLSILLLAGLFYALIAIPASHLADRTERRMSRHL